MAPGRKIQYPSKEEWGRHKDEIVRLYMTENMRLDDVQRVMEREHNFKANNRMYKTRLTSWRITKYNPEAIMATLVRNIENRKSRGKRTSIYKNDVPFSWAKIESHLKKKGMTVDQLLRKAPLDAAMPAGFICVTPPPEQPGYTPSSHASAFTPVDQGGITQTPPTSGNDSHLSSSGHNLTPQSTPERRQEPSQGPAMLQNSDAGPISNVAPWTVAGPFNDSGTDLFQIMGHGLGDLAADDPSWSCMIDISGEALFLTSPGTSSYDNVLDTNLHVSMSTDMQDQDCYHPLQCHPEKEPQRSLSAAFDPQPEAFVAFCYLACMLHGRGQEEAASNVASEAFRIYQTLIKQEHEQALACLNLILTVLFMYGQSLFAVDLLKNAHQTALCHFHKESPIMVTISFMVQQASRTVMQCGITHTRLRVVYDDFRESRTLKHPYTLLAGYHLAWRLALDGGDSLEEAHRLLSELQSAADDSIDRAHMQTIAILTTKARVLHDLKHREDAEKLMSKAIERIEMRYHAKHPYTLEAKRRHSIFLYAVNKISAAEKRLIEVALGRVEVLGPDHTFSKQSVKDVEQFLATPDRDLELSKFTADLTETMARSGTQTSTTGTLQFW